MVAMANNPKLSVVIVFFNMRREAQRTLHTLTCQYQQDILIDDYEVLVMDSGSTEPLGQCWVESLQSNFHYYYVATEHPSPCKSINFGVSQSRAQLIAISIDGARMLSPNILSQIIRMSIAYPNPFVYTLSMHLGTKLQNIAVEEGYDQVSEDTLLATVDWQNDGYLLFNIACLAASSGRGYTGYISESNFFAVGKNVLTALGGFDERFKSPGGGLVNLHVFARLLENPQITPVLLLGEATFHQFHGGVATNVPMSCHPWEIYQEEYKVIYGKEFIHTNRESVLFGKNSVFTRRLLAI
jgi:Glycosyl transferase family 2.